MTRKIWIETEVQVTKKQLFLKTVKICNILSFPLIEIKPFYAIQNFQIQIFLSISATHFMDRERCELGILMWCKMVYSGAKFILDYF